MSPRNYVYRRVICNSKDIYEVNIIACLDHIQRPCVHYIYVHHENE